jgi:hypothetical protein
MHDEKPEGGGESADCGEGAHSIGMRVFGISLNALRRVFQLIHSYDTAV